MFNALELIIPDRPNENKANSWLAQWFYSSWTRVENMQSGHNSHLFYSWQRIDSPNLFMIINYPWGKLPYIVIYTSHRSCNTL